MNVIASTDVFQVVVLNESASLIIVDEQGLLRGVSQGLCEQLLIEPESLHGMTLQRFESEWYEIAVVVPAESEFSIATGDSSSRSAVAWMRVLPRMDVLLGGHRHRPSWLLCDLEGTVVVSAAVLLGSPGGGLLRGRPNVQDLIPMASGALAELVRSRAEQPGVSASLDLRLANAVAVRLTATCTDENSVELEITRSNHEPHALTDWVKHPIFHRTAELLGEAISIHDLDGRTIQINRAGRELIGLESATSVDPPQLFDAVHPNERQMVGGMLAAALRGATTRAVWRLHNASAVEDRWTESVVKPVRGENGEFVRLLVISKDVTQRRALDVRAEQLAMIAERTSNMVCLTDSEGRIDWINAAFEQRSGYRLQQLRGQTLGSFLQSPGIDESANQRINRAMSQGRSIRLPLTNYDRAGTEYQTDLTIDPIRDRIGGLAGFFSLQSDITHIAGDIARSGRLDLRRQVALDAAGLGYWEFDRSSHALHVSSLFIEHFGLNAGIDSRLTVGSLLRALPKQSRRQLTRVLRNRREKKSARLDFTLTMDTGLIQHSIEIKGRSLALGVNIAWVGTSILVLAPQLNLATLSSADRDLAAAGSIAAPLTAADDEPGQVAESGGGHVVRALTLDSDRLSSTKDALDRRDQLLSAIAKVIPSAAAFQLRIEANESATIALASESLPRLCADASCSARNAGDLLLPNAHAGLRAEIAAQVKQACITGEMLEMEFSVSQRLGERWYSLSGQSQAVALGGHYLSAVLRDISERKGAEQVFAEREQIVRNIGDNLPNGFVFQMIRESGGTLRFTYVSAGFERLTGITRQDISVSIAPLVRLLSASDAIKLERRIRESMRRLNPLDCEFGLSVDHRQVFRVLQFSARPRPFTGGATLWEGVAIDVSQRHRCDEEKRKLILRLEHQFTESESVNFALSHDLKGAILGIRGQLDIALELADAADLMGVRDRLARVVGITQSMWQLLAQMLELSRLERAGLQLCTIEFAELLHPTLDLLSGLSEQLGVPLVLETPEIQFDCDALRLQSVLLNLIGNALKFSPPGSAPVRIRATVEAEHVVLSITDSGIGIEAQYLERVFSLFERLDQTKEGSGVGLALVRRVVEMHNGQAWATSEGVGKGTTVWVSLPRLQPLDADSMPSQTPAADHQCGVSHLP